MTIICPRCAVRFPAALAQDQVQAQVQGQAKGHAQPGAVTSLFCPACGARLQVRGELSKRTSSSQELRPASSAGAKIGQAVPSSPSAPVLRRDAGVSGFFRADHDLPSPKRPVEESGGASSRGSTGSSSVPLLGAASAQAATSSGTGQAPVALRQGEAGQAALHVSPELLQDLPLPRGPLPRQAQAMATPPTRATAAAEPAAGPQGETQRAPVTRPELPATRRSPSPAMAHAVATGSRQERPANASTARATQPEIPAVGASAPQAAAAATTAAALADGASRPGPGLSSPYSDQTAPSSLPAIPSSTLDTHSQEQQVHVAAGPSASDPALRGQAKGRGPSSADLAIPPVFAAGPESEQAAGAGLAAPAPKGAALSPKPAAVLPDEPALAAAPAMLAERPQKDLAAESAVLTTASQVTDPMPEAAATPIESAEPALEPSAPPHLPMGWIIGALFMIALLLTLWIAHRAGVFGPPAPVLFQFDPTTETAPPRLP